MKKKLLSLVFIGLFLICSISFVSCDKKDQVKVTLCMNETCKTVECNKYGKLDDFDLLKLFELENRIGGPIVDGLFYDSSCLLKYDTSKHIENDITLYVGYHYLNPENIDIYFIFEGATYHINRQSNYPVTVFDFIASAYGKPISPACLEFYGDEAMTNRFELYGLNYQTACQTISMGIPTSYTIYVKRVPAPALPSYDE